VPLNEIQVQAFAKDKLDPAQMSVIVAGDAKAMGDDLAKAAPNATVIPAAKLDLDAPSLTK
jgi:zinc protease